jgi:hypothetical protein
VQDHAELDFHCHQCKYYFSEHILRKVFSLNTIEEERSFFGVLFALRVEALKDMEFAILPESVPFAVIQKNVSKKQQQVDKDYFSEKFQINRFPIPVGEYVAENIANFENSEMYRGQYEKRKAIIKETEQFMPKFLKSHSDEIGPSLTFFEKCKSKLCRGFLDEKGSCMLCNFEKIEKDNKKSKFEMSKPVDPDFQQCKKCLLFTGHVSGDFQFCCSCQILLKLKTGEDIREKFKTVIYDKWIFEDFEQEFFKNFGIKVPKLTENIVVNFDFIFKLNIKNIFKDVFPEQKFTEKVVSDYKKWRFPVFFSRNRPEKTEVNPTVEAFIFFENALKTFNTILAKYRPKGSDYYMFTWNRQARVDYLVGKQEDLKILARYERTKYLEKSMYMEFLIETLGIFFVNFFQNISGISKNDVEGGKIFLDFLKDHIAHKFHWLEESWDLCDNSRFYRGEIFDV